MATLSALQDGGVLHKLDPGLPADQQELRLIVATERCMKWIIDDLPDAQSDWEISLSPLEQLASMVEDFCGGKPLRVGPHFKVLHPNECGVWALKAPDIRIFGWFHSVDCFVAVVGDSASRIKKHHLYAGYIGEVVRFRDQLDLDEPKFLEGAEPNAVVSNCS